MSNNTLSGETDGISADESVNFTGLISVLDDNFQIRNDPDNTRIAKFDCSAIPTTTENIYTLQNIGTSSTLAAFKTIPTTDANFSASPYLLTPAFQYSYSVLGDRITFRFFAFSASTNSTSGITTNVIVPVEYRTATVFQQPILGPIAGVQNVIRTRINTNGTFNIFPINGTTFGVSASVTGWDAFEVSWRYGI